MQAGQAHLKEGGEGIRNDSNLVYTFFFLGRTHILTFVCTGVS